jgi:XRE family aerobic/anaerobic benzoate catabolism transcriptional regulator
MTRRILAQASGVSERYLAELERGSGNASLLVLKQIADALGTAVQSLVAQDDPAADETALIVQRLRRLSANELATARDLLNRHFSPKSPARGNRIALVGLRGAGKSTVGALLAERLQVPFVELDREIERAAAMETADILAVHGQAHFRKLERSALEAVLQAHPRVVIATGGGLVTETATYELLLAECFVLWLRASPTQHMSRVVAQGDLRPMADNPQAMEDLRAILESRAALYARADAELDTSSLTPQTAADAVLRMVGRRETQELNATMFW